MTTQQQMATDEATMWRGVVSLYAQIETELSKALQRDHQLGLSDYRALALLSVAQDGELRMQGLASGIGLNQSSISRLVVRLENAGLTERAFCPDDRRGVYSVITAEGRRRHEAAAPTYEETLRMALAQAASEPHHSALVGLLRG